MYVSPVLCTVLVELLTSGLQETEPSQVAVQWDRKREAGSYHTTNCCLPYHQPVLCTSLDEIVVAHLYLGCHVVYCDMLKASGEGFLLHVSLRACPAQQL